MKKINIFKRTCCLVMTLLMGLFILTACSSDKDSDSSGRDTGDDDGSIREELTAVELTEIMGNGINLGNTMEAYGHLNLGTSAEVSEYETYWGMPVTTQEMVTGMKDAGFDTLRIPIAWTNMMDFENGDYTIDQKYLDRVGEIIDYARNAGMYVIINDHWDGGWWGMFGSADETTRNNAMEMYKSMWKQIANEYKDYSDYLIFESGNEEIGNRLNDTDIAKDSGTLSEDDCFEVAKNINQAFVDTVRETGGNNENRFLLIAGYGTEISNTVDSRFVMPTDTAKNKLLISVHFYDPSSYCIDASISTWGNKTQYDVMQEKLAQMSTFTEKGYGVIIGECGVLMGQDRTVRENTVEYLTNLLNLCDINNYCPVLWDCNGMYDRETYKIIDEDVAAMYTDHSYATQSTKSAEDIKTEAQAEIDAAYAAAEEDKSVSADEAVAWIMYTSGDWVVSYRVGDEYKEEFTEGIVANDAEITGAGEYTVSLDFTGTQAGFGTGVTFSALGIINGETLFPGYCIVIKEIDINGESVDILDGQFTTTDNQNCTRTNIYNTWVTSTPDEARTPDGNLDNATPNIIDIASLGNIETISVTFEYVAP